MSGDASIPYKETDGHEGLLKNFHIQTVQSMGKSSTVKLFRFWGLMLDIFNSYETSIYFHSVAENERTIKLLHCSFIDFW